LATSVPSVVSPTDSPTSSEKVKVPLTTIRPNSVFSA
jgi:hypothetical protein